MTLRPSSVRKPFLGSANLISAVSGIWKLTTFVLPLDRGLRAAAVRAAGDCVGFRLGLAVVPVRGQLLGAGRQRDPELAVLRPAVELARAVHVECSTASKNAPCST